MTVVIPLWFYEFGSVMYFFAAIIGFLLSFFSFKLYNFTRKRAHLLLNLSFIFLTTGFLILAISNFYTVFTFEKCEPSCVVSSDSHVFHPILYGNYGYYIFSTIGYSLFLFSYPIFKTRRRNVNSSIKMLPAVSIGVLLNSPQVFVLYPFENLFFQIFHLVSAILLFFIVTQTFSNYRKTKMNHSLLVTVGFAAILFYHALMLSIPYSPLFFAFAHMSLLIGFGSLLIMLVRVTRR